MLATEVSVEFEYFLADRLRMTVARLRDEMTNHEFVYWQMYHSRHAQEYEMANKKGGHG